MVLEMGKSESVPLVSAKAQQDAVPSLVEDSGQMGICE